MDNDREPSRCISFDSYIKPQLRSVLRADDAGCISFDSYIKPQLDVFLYYLLIVVYLLIPTSNHNCIVELFYDRQVVYLLIPTSNHNGLRSLHKCRALYIF